ncbi:MAG: hypothetical protein AB1758_21550 [Candidatus Eremiobacterota bacterium]
MLGQAGSRIESQPTQWVAGTSTSDKVEFRETEAEAAAMPLVTALYNSNTLSPAPGMQSGPVYGREITGVTAGMQAGGVYSSTY